MGDFGIFSIRGLNMSRLELFFAIVLMRSWLCIAVFTQKFRYIHIYIHVRAKEKHLAHKEIFFPKIPSYYQKVIQKNIAANYGYITSNVFRI